MGDYSDVVNSTASGAAAGSIVPGWGTAIGAGYGLVSGLIKHNKAQKAIDELGKTPYPKFTLSPQLSNAYGRAEEMAKQGYTAPEIAAFNQNLAQQNTLALRQGTDRAGGQMAGALNAGINAMNLGAINQFAGQDAMLKRQNIRYSDTLAQALQSQQNLASQAEIARRNALEQAYGMAAQQQGQNIAGSVMALGSLYDRGFGGNKMSGGGMYNPSYPPPTNMGYNYKLSPSLNYNAPYEGAPTDYSNSSAYGH